jgi:hypothetical protein
MRGNAPAHERRLLDADHAACMRCRTLRCHSRHYKERKPGIDICVGVRDSDGFPCNLGKEQAMENVPASRIGQMNIMDRSGHKELTWDTARLSEVMAAKETFDGLMKKGYTAFGSKYKADAKHLVREFDPTLEELVVVPKTVGG